MQILVSTTVYHIFAKVCGALFSLYGGGLLITHARFLLTGKNPLASDLQPLGLGIAALMGAFALAIGIPLFFSDGHTDARVQMAAIAFALNALIRLSMLAVPELRTKIGATTPIVEFCVCITFAFFAFTLYPKA